MLYYSLRPSHWCSYLSITFCPTDFDKVKVIFCVATDGWADRQDLGVFIWKHVGTQNNSIQSSKLGASCRAQYAFPDDSDA